MSLDFALPIACDEFGLLESDRAGRKYSRQNGVVTPLGLVLLTLGIVVFAIAVALLARLIGNSHISVAQRTAQVTATRSAAVGLDYLVNGTLPGTPIPILALPEPARTEAVSDRIQTVALPTAGARPYLAPFLPGDIEVELSMLSARVVVTARAGRTGQFSYTASQVAAVRAANAVGAGQLLRVPGSVPMTSGVLPLAIDASAVARSEVGSEVRTPKSVPIAFGTNAFVVGDLVDGDRSGTLSMVDAESRLVEVATFLGYAGRGEPRGTAPRAYAVGQSLVLNGTQSLSEEGIMISRGGLASVSSPESEGSVLQGSSQQLVDQLLARLGGRPVIVPVVRDSVVRAFAVGILEPDIEGGMTLAFLPSALSPLARIDPEVAQVADGLEWEGGLAMGLTPSQSSQGEEASGSSTLSANQSSAIG